MSIYSSSAMRNLGIGSILLTILIFIPVLGADRYLLGQIILFLIYAAVATHWNLLFGYAGIFSLAQLTMFGIGAYAMAMLSFYFDLSIWLAIPLAGIIALLAALILGLATLRLAGVYTALLTLAVAQVITVLIVTDTECFIQTETSCRLLTGGAAGFYGFEDFGTRKAFGRDWLVANYYIVLTAAGLTILVSHILSSSTFGIALQALRDNPVYATTLGVNKFWMHLQVFALSAFLTGLMGAVYAGHIRTVSPSVMSLSQMLYLVAAVVLGGAGHAWGPVLGLAFLMIADEILRDFGAARQIGIGIILVMVPILFSKGILKIQFPKFQKQRQSTT